MSPAPLTIAALKALRTRFEAGEDIAVLVAAAGCSERRLYQKWRRQGWVSRPLSRRRGTEDLSRALWQRRCAGESTEELAAEAGVSPRGLRKRWAALGFDTQAQKVQETMRLDGEIACALWARYLRGETSAALAKEAGVARVTLTHWWSDLGLAARNVQAARLSRAKRLDEGLRLALDGRSAREIVVHLGVTQRNATTNTRRSIQRYAARVGVRLPSEWR